MVGALAAGPIADRFGRRIAMFVGECGMAYSLQVNGRLTHHCISKPGGAFIQIGMALCASASNINHIIGGRFILGWGIAIMTWVHRLDYYITFFFNTNVGVSQHMFSVSVRLLTVSRSLLPIGEEDSSAFITVSSVLSPCSLSAS